jgi:hypothetical protein
VPWLTNGSTTNAASTRHLDVLHGLEVRPDLAHRVVERERADVVEGVDGDGLALERFGALDALGDDLDRELLRGRDDQRRRVREPGLEIAADDLGGDRRAPLGELRADGQVLVLENPSFMPT